MWFTNKVNINSCFQPVTLYVFFLCYFTDFAFLYNIEYQYLRQTYTLYFKSEKKKKRMIFHHRVEY